MTPGETRVAILHNGYVPIPASGKACYIEGWSTKTATNAAEIEVQSKQYRDHSNTGILTRNAPAIDIDITFQPAAEAVEHLAKETFGERGDIIPVRIGQPPSAPSCCVQMNHSKRYGDYIPRRTAASIRSRFFATGSKSSSLEFTPTLASRIHGMAARR